MEQMPGAIRSAAPSPWTFVLSMPVKYRRTALAHALLAGAAAFVIGTPAVGQSPPPGIPKAPASAAPPDDGQWSMPAKNYANTRYSELDEINTVNVKDLRVAFTFSTGVNRGQESAPLVVGG